MSMTTTAIAGAPEQPLSTWSGDDMGATGAYGDLIRDIAQDYFTAQEKRRDHLSGQGEQAPWRDGLEDQQATMADQTRTTFAALWPRRPRPRIQEASLTPRQEWEGYVVEVNETTFTARLVDLTAGREQEEEEADIPVAELSDADRLMLQPGAIFRWAIGYRRTRAGTKERVSRIVFRRLPAWTERELQENRRQAETLAATLGGE